MSPAQPTPRPFSAISSSSSIDPVLLTKSDNLVRAELQLRRQQIERQIKDQFDRKGRGNDADERDPHLNVEDCLIKAQLLVPPVSGIRSTTNNSDGAESFDENSYYSSKADSWSSEELDPNQNTNADPAGPLISQAKRIPNASAQSRHVQPAVIDLDEEAYEPADDIEIYEPEPAGLNENAEEEDYSPPPADIGVHEPSRGRARDRGPQNQGGTNGYAMIFVLNLFLHMPYCDGKHITPAISAIRIVFVRLSACIVMVPWNISSQPVTIKSWIAFEPRDRLPAERLPNDHLEQFLRHRQ
jgi:hypothetical protein